MNVHATIILPFESAVNDVSAGNKKVQKSDYLAAGLYPVVDQGQDFVGGFSNDDENLVDGNGPWIVFGDHTRVLKYVDFPFCMGADGVKVLKPRSEHAIDTKYLFHFLAAHEVPTAGYSRHYKFLKRLEIALPPLDEQRRIVAILDKAEELCRKRKRALALHNSLAQSIFLGMFGDPLANPKAFPLSPLSEIADTRLGKMLDAAKQTSLPKFKYLANTNVQWGRFELGDLREMGFSEDDRVDFSLRNGDLLICEGGEIGRCAIWREEIGDCYFQKALHRVRCNLTFILPEFLEFYFLLMAKNGGLSKLTTAATIPHLTGVKLRTLQVPVPPMSDQMRFALACKNISAQQRRLEGSWNALGQLFSSLQSRAFSGQL